MAGYRGCAGAYCGIMPGCICCGMYDMPTAIPCGGGTAGGAEAVAIGAAVPEEGEAEAAVAVAEVADAAVSADGMEKDGVKLLAEGLNEKDLAFALSLDFVVFFSSVFGASAVVAFVLFLSLSALFVSAPFSSTFVCFSDTAFTSSFFSVSAFTDLSFFAVGAASFSLSSVAFFSASDSSVSDAAIGVGSSPGGRDGVHFPLIESLLVFESSEFFSSSTV
mmetsp:Transcript_27710/g.40938  ORF Transcript_27710/g.40938 Transcript_27710/m.40938 type:complete len:220 (-) Transcript_27710:861-1520(-)